MLQYITAMLVGLGVLSAVPTQADEVSGKDTLTKPATQKWSGKLQSVRTIPTEEVPPLRPGINIPQIVGYQLVEDNGTVWELDLGSRTMWRRAAELDGRYVELEATKSPLGSLLVVRDLKPLILGCLDVKDLKPQAPKVVGLKVEEATRVAKEAGYTVRIISQDSVSFAMTDDLRSDRLNLSVEKGIVIAVRIG